LKGDGNQLGDAPALLLLASMLLLLASVLPRKKGE